MKNLKLDNKKYLYCNKCKKHPSNMEIEEIETTRARRSRKNKSTEWTIIKNDNEIKSYCGDCGTELIEK